MGLDLLSHILFWLGILNIISMECSKYYLKRRQKLAAGMRMGSGNKQGGVIIKVYMDKGIHIWSVYIIM